ncbi:MAG: response regulator [Butyrivibrio sp.]|nr:response regulator [Butyrivibrio sp.]
MLRSSWDAAGITETGTTREPGAIVLYLGDMDAAAAESALTAAAAVARDAGIPFYEVGNEAEISAAAVVVPQEVITAVFGRPLDTQRLADALESVFAQGDSSDAQRHTILVVDDDGTMLRMIKTWLGEAYSVYMAGSGRVAMDFLQGRQVDLILLDYRMPEMDGVEVFKTLRSQEGTRGIPVIFLTGKNDEQELEILWRLGPDGVLLKSMPREQLIGEVQAFFKKKDET